MSFSLSLQICISNFVLVKKKSFHPSYNTSYTIFALHNVSYLTPLLHNCGPSHTISHLLYHLLHHFLPILHYFCPSYTISPLLHHLLHYWYTGLCVYQIVYIHTYTCISVLWYSCIYTCIWFQQYTYTYIHIYIYIYTVYQLHENPNLFLELQLKMYGDGWLIFFSYLCPNAVFCDEIFCTKQSSFSSTGIMTACDLLRRALTHHQT